MYRSFPALVGMVIVTVCGCGSSTTVDRAASQQRVHALMLKVNQAWETEDLESFARIVAHDADMVCFGSDLDEHWVGWDAIAAGLRRQFETFDNTRVTPHQIVIHLSPAGDTAWIAQTMGIQTEFLGSPISLEARITVVCAQRETEWRLVHFHYSLPISESLRIGT